MKHVRLVIFGYSQWASYRSCQVLAIRCIFDLMSTNKLLYFNQLSIWKQSIVFTILQTPIEALSQSLKMVFCHFQPSILTHRLGSCYLLLWLVLMETDSCTKLLTSDLCRQKEKKRQTMEPLRCC